MPAPSSDYDLLDFGRGRKLERFGPYVLDRPAAAAEGVEPAAPEQWRKAACTYHRQSGDTGVWRPESALPESCEVSFELESASPASAHSPPGEAARDDPRGASRLRFELRASPFGHIGVFPEQTECWSWIARQVARAGPPLRVLNLFAYTGGSTLAAAAAGAEITHVDSARNIITRARRNAELSGLAERPIRWICEDAMRFCQREVKRGNRYDAVILDPPSYGHGPKGEVWQIGSHLLPLLQLCGELTGEGRAFLLATCHSPSIGPAELSAYLSEGIFGHCGQPPQSGTLWLTTAAGRRLDCGVYARWGVGK